MNKIILLPLLVISFGMLLACKNSNFEKLKEEFAAQQMLSPNGTVNLMDTSKTISFKDDIMFIMKAQCGSGDNNCHSAQAVAAGTSSIALYDYAGVQAAQVPDGLLYSSVIWDGNSSKMPSKSKSKIDALYIGAIKKWIDNGMPNN